MSKTTARAKARTAPKANDAAIKTLAETLADKGADTKPEPNIENDMYDLVRILRAADHLLADDNEDLEASGHLLVTKAREMAEEIDFRYQSRAYEEQRGGYHSSAEAAR